MDSDSDSDTVDKIGQNKGPIVLSPSTQKRRFRCNPVARMNLIDFSHGTHLRIPALSKSAPAEGMEKEVSAKGAATGNSYQPRVSNDTETASDHSVDGACGDGKTPHQNAVLNESPADQDSSNQSQGTPAPDANCTGTNDDSLPGRAPPEKSSLSESFPPNGMTKGTRSQPPPAGTISSDGIVLPVQRSMQEVGLDELAFSDGSEKHAVNDILLLDATFSRSTGIGRPCLPSREVDSNKLGGVEGPADITTDPLRDARTTPATRKSSMQLLTPIELEMLKMQDEIQTYGPSVEQVPRKPGSDASLKRVASRHPNLRAIALGEHSAQILPLQVFHCSHLSTVGFAGQKPENKDASGDESELNIGGFNRRQQTRSILPGGTICSQKQPAFEPNYYRAFGAIFGDTDIRMTTPNKPHPIPLFPRRTMAFDKPNTSEHFSRHRAQDSPNCPVMEVAHPAGVHRSKIELGLSTGGEKRQFKDESATSVKKRKI
ncbi:hypothetical protein B0H11DRAFT_2192475 [Mycena galericulata]|nr:hypothetical protein B0H11DRAFT_2192475 [Mycena galericulata]